MCPSPELDLINLFTKLHQNIDNFIISVDFKNDYFLKDQITSLLMFVYHTCATQQSGVTFSFQNAATERHNEWNRGHVRAAAGP